MWRSEQERIDSAVERLTLARDIWGWQPHPAQESFFRCAAQIRIAACGRRWGKTECLSADIASLAISEVRHGRACRQLIVAPQDGQARLLGALVESRLHAAFAAHKAWTKGLALTVHRHPVLEMTVTRPQVNRVRFRTPENYPAVSGVIQCRSAAREGTGLRGLWAHRIIADEAGRIPDIVLTEVLLPMLADVGGEYTLASSPAGRRSAFYRMWARGASMSTAPAPGLVSYASFQCPTSDNIHLDAAILEDYAEEMDEQTYRQEILAEFVDDWGAVFREEDIDGCLAANPDVTSTGGALLSEPQSGRLYSAGIDWGRIQDFTVLCILDATERPARLVYLERWHGTSWATQARQIARVLVRFAPVRTLADRNAMGDPLIEKLTEQIEAVISARDTALTITERTPLVEKFVFGPDSKLSLVDRLTLGLSARALSYPAYPTLLSELRGFQYGTPGRSGRAPMAARGSGHDDCVMALALAWWCAPTISPLNGPATRLLLGSQLAGAGEE